MKKTAIVALITASALLVTGAGSAAATSGGKEEQAITVTRTVYAIHKPVPGGYLDPSDPGTWIPDLQNVKYEMIDISQAPAEIQEWVSPMIKTGGKGAKTVGDKTYILYALGERPTGGYGVDIVGATENGGGLVVTVRENAPDPDSMVLQMITYPYVLVAVKKTELPVKFVIVEKVLRKPDKIEPKRVIPRAAYKVKNIDQ